MDLVLHPYLPRSPLIESSLLELFCKLTYLIIKIGPIFLRTRNIGLLYVVSTWYGDGEYHTKFLCTRCGLSSNHPLLMSFTFFLNDH